MIGAGLAGSEAAWQLARRGIAVTLREMKPQKMTPAHTSPDFAELVCSNSLRSDQLENAVGLLEEVLRRLEPCGVCLIGPGLGRGNSVGSVVRHVLRTARLPMVVDADGINALAGHIDGLDVRQGECTVLTPHDGEFVRLGGDLSGGDRLAAARAFAAEHGCVMVLKGHRTITAFPDGEAYVNTTGNPGMAKGGSGDVLSGIILSLLGQGLPPRMAVPMAVCLHGMAGDRCAEALGEYGMTPGDMIETLPAVLKEITRKS